MVWPVEIEEIYFVVTFDTSWCDVMKRHSMTSWHYLTTLRQEYWQGGHIKGGYANSAAFSCNLSIIDHEAGRECTWQPPSIRSFVSLFVWALLFWYLQPTSGLVKKMKPASFFLSLAITQSIVWIDSITSDFDFLTSMSHFGFIFSEPGLVRVVTDRPTDGRYQVHYLPTSQCLRSITIWTFPSNCI